LQHVPTSRYQTRSERGLCLGLVFAEVPPLVALAVPVVAGLIGATALSAIDSFMLGPLGEVPLAAASLTQSVIIIFYAGLFGLVGAVGLLAGQAHGAGDELRIASILRHGLVVAAIGGTLGAAIMAVSYFLLPYTGQPPEVMASLPVYWFLMSALLMPFAVLIAIKQVLDSIERPWTGAVLSFMPVIINIPLNWLLIYGKMGLPALGLVGAGIASLTAFLVSIVITYLYIRFAPAMARYREAVALHCAGFAEQTREGYPMSIQYLAEGGSVAVAGVLMGWLGATSLAANQIVFSVGALVYMAPLGMSAAVSIRIAQALGEGGGQRVRAIGLAGIGVVTIWMLGFTALMMLAGGTIARQFVSEPHVIAVAAAMFISVGVMQVFDGLQSVSLGALRGMLDNQWPTRVSLIAYWLIALPMSVLLGFTFGFGGPGIWAGFGIGIGVAGVALVWRFLARE
jgi:multidrug resistance protein, MATE family